MPARKEKLPSTIERSPAKVRRTYAKALEATARGVDERGSTKQELYERARKLGIRGRSRMDKRELAQAVGRRQ